MLSTMVSQSRTRNFRQGGKLFQEATGEILVPGRISNHSVSAKELYKVENVRLFVNRTIKPYTWDR